MPINVMIVDDSAVVRQVMEDVLKRHHDIKVIATAADPIFAMAKMQQKRPDVILLDIEMPRMDGYDLTRNIRADDRLRPLPIIMITSRMADKHRNYAFEIGVNHYLGKPYNEEELLGLIKDFVKR